MELLSIKALKWLKSVDYQHRSHDEREILIKDEEFNKRNS